MVAARREPWPTATVVVWVMMLWIVEATRVPSCATSSTVCGHPVRATRMALPVPPASNRDKEQPMLLLLQRPRLELPRLMTVSCAWH
uniref:Putative secreted protein n=1 Tax=Anopheles marajoara TaxID=58244 RepID=A0A2M4CAR7_9DIPT